MGLFDELASKASGFLGGGGGEQSGLAGGVMTMLSESGGLSGLVQSFQEKGLGRYHLVLGRHRLQLADLG